MRKLIRKYLMFRTDANFKALQRYIDKHPMATVLLFGNEVDELKKLGFKL